LLAAVAAAVLVAATAGAFAAPPPLRNAVVNGSFERPVVAAVEPAMRPAVRREAKPRDTKAGATNRRVMRPNRPDMGRLLLPTL